MSAQLLAGMVLLTVSATVGVILHAIVRRAADRIAAWVLPENQPCSFRIAWLIAKASERLAPRHEYRFFVSRSPEGLVPAEFLPWRYGAPWQPDDTLPLARHAEGHWGWSHSEVRFHAVVRPRGWCGPEAALAELHADLASDVRVLKPVRLTAPLLSIALRLRMEQMIHRRVIRREPRRYPRGCWVQRPTTRLWWRLYVDRDSHRKSGSVRPRSPGGLT